MNRKVTRFVVSIITKKYNVDAKTVSYYDNKIDCGCGEKDTWHPPHGRGGDHRRDLLGARAASRLLDEKSYTVLHLMMVIGILPSVTSS